MFTGIISDVGTVRALERRGDTRFIFATGYDTTTIAIGASIACSGPCLTVVDKGPDWFAADVSAETLACTTLGRWRVGTRVNFERALQAGQELGGHLVLGHVDGVAMVTARTSEGESLRLVFEAPASLGAFIASKGSVALDGVSLTVNEVDGLAFGVNIIPHTQRQTTLGALEVGDVVNLEVDVLARYAARWLERR
jgi:riboflavin synthase